ncbi:hypothetical protein FBY41_0164 [Humibacillus xanthopallidus]|uniref:Uncharacterized protein n=1 Tax=Humibacillus xanthopallidus TaxID=412689 RepID=A0A543HZP0_9MICO|nr:hypothetical protein FBY41_0164 [Humibacillus xanthopallidus]
MTVTVRETVRETVTETDPRDAERLMDLASTEVATIDELAACVERLHEVQRAKVALSRLDPEALRQALDARRRASDAGPS